jgi:hypothetical protein
MILQPNVANKVERLRYGLSVTNLHVLLTAAQYALEDAQMFDWITVDCDLIDEQLADLRQELASTLEVSTEFPCFTHSLN